MVNNGYLCHLVAVCFVLRALDGLKVCENLRERVVCLPEANTKNETIVFAQSLNIATNRTAGFFDAFSTICEYDKVFAAQIKHCTRSGNAAEPNAVDSDDDVPVDAQYIEQP
jgi:hypothetical protein